MARIKKDMMAQHGGNGKMRVLTVNFTYGHIRKPNTSSSQPPHPGFGGFGATAAMQQQFSLRYSKQELIPINSNLMIKDFYNLLKDYAKNILQTACKTNKFGKVVMLPVDSKLFTSSNFELRVDETDDFRSVWSQVCIGDVISPS